MPFTHTTLGATVGTGRRFMFTLTRAQHDSCKTSARTAAHAVRALRRSVAVTNRTHCCVYMHELLHAIVRSSCHHARAPALDAPATEYLQQECLAAGDDTAADDEFAHR